MTTYDDWKTRSDRDENPSPEDERDDFDGPEGMTYEEWQKENDNRELPEASPDAGPEDDEVAF